MTVEPESEELFDLKTNYFIGNYQYAITEASTIQSSDARVNLEKNVFMYRSHVALGQYDVVLNEVAGEAGAAAVEVQAVRLQARYLSAESERPAVLQELQEWLADPALEKNGLVMVILASILRYEENFQDALQCVHAAPTLECVAMHIHLLLCINRVDLAEKKLKQMMAVDDDATLTQLASAWVFLGIGGRKAEEAYYIFQELVDKFEETVQLLNGIAVCYMHQQKYEEAEQALLRAMSKRGGDPETLVNMTVVAGALAKPADLVNRYLLQLKSGAATNPYVRRLTALEAQFDSYATTYAADA